MAVRKTASGCRIQGFTLVEVVIVLLVLGILASIAIPRFVDLRRDALLGTLKGIEGALHSTMVDISATCRDQGCENRVPPGERGKCPVPFRLPGRTLESSVSLHTRYLYQITQYRRRCPLYAKSALRRGQSDFHSDCRRNNGWSRGHNMAGGISYQRTLLCLLLQPP